MADAKHTQDGEWNCDSMTAEGPITISGGKLRLIKSGDFIVAFLPMWGEVEAERLEARANARLIAAAPKMLDALRMIADGFAHGAIKSKLMLANVDDEAVDTMPMLPGDIVRAVIAQATGDAT